MHHSTNDALKHLCVESSFKLNVFVPLIELTRKMNQTAYFNILCYQVLPLILHIMDTAVYEDNDSCVHNTSWIRDWHEEYSFTLSHLESLVKSPDFSRTENLWDNFKQRVKSQNQHDYDVQLQPCDVAWSVHAGIVSTWKGIPAEQPYRLFSSPNSDGYQCNRRYYIALQRCL